MQETLAAAIIRLSGWNGLTPLYDPMCGSGTLLFEALMHYCAVPSGYFRESFGFRFMPDFDEHTWNSVKKEADEKIRPLEDSLIAGSDISSQAIEMARMNSHNLPSGRNIRFSKLKFQDIKSIRDTTIVCDRPMAEDEKQPGHGGTYAGVRRFSQAALHRVNRICVFRQP